MAAADTPVLAHQIAWFTSGGNTIVYANSSNVDELPTAANMEIHLTTVATLAALDFIHV